MSLKPFLQWLAEHGVSLREGLSIVESPKGEISVWLNSEDPVLHPETIASIPKSSILSARTCAIAQNIAWAPVKGTESKWHTYLQSLPSTPVPIARLWGDPYAFPDDADSQEATRWIYGTEIQKELQDEDGSPLMDEAHAFYKADVQPLLDSLGFDPTMHGFLHAYSLVCSRAFLVDAYHGLSMVPVADAEDVSMHPPASIAPQTDFSDTVDMVTVRSIPPQSEVFNTYGADLGNAALLARYGFALEGGETDVVTFGWSGSGIVLDNDQDQEVFRTVYKQALEVVGDMVHQSVLIYAPKEENHNARPFTVNSDGQTSLGLFVWAVWNALNERPPPKFDDMDEAEVLTSSLCYLPRIVQALVQLEAIREETAEAQEIEIADDMACQLLEEAAEALASLCRARASAMGKKGYRGVSSGVLGDILDNLPPDYKKTRLALEYLLSERALLEACAAGWEEIRDYLSGESVADDDSDMDE
ncbi:hypothetical protein BN946_scf184945.g39 [Trametes cinnabarina]|uniref:SET domain-containing protein n=1 Tax=Pycnoporus cinnabarinus TaxID=5643 RepID=A0A060SKC4_PYCCI|nr:hypothetical protein BN946_scf184945.g39 [Trametes cinnabarina]